MNRHRLPALTFLAVGAALGYIAASTSFRGPAVLAATPPASAGEREDIAGCCPKGLNTGVLLAQTAGRIPLAELRRADNAGSARKPNIVVIMGDDVGWFNIGAYHRGMMAGRTPHLDRMAAQGLLFTDYYAERSCTVEAARVAVFRRGGTRRRADRRRQVSVHRPAERLARRDG